MHTSGPEPIPSRIVLDTSAYSRLRRGHAEVVEAVALAEVVFVPATVVGELEAGFRGGSRFLENRRSLDDFLSERYVRFVEVTVEVARLYGEVFAGLKSAGTPIPVNDIWIAAAARFCGGHLVAFDTDFRKVPGLPLTLLADD